MTIDEETLRLYEEMRAAARDGNLLSYANNLARSMAGGRIPDERMRNSPRVSPQSNEGQSGPQPRRALFQENIPPRNEAEAVARLNNSVVGRQIPASSARTLPLPSNRRYLSACGRGSSPDIQNPFLNYHPLMFLFPWRHLPRAGFRVINLKSNIIRAFHGFSSFIRQPLGYFPRFCPPYTHTKVGQDSYLRL